MRIWRIREKDTVERDVDRVLISVWKSSITQDAPADPDLSFLLNVNDVISIFHIYLRLYESIFCSVHHAADHTDIMVLSALAFKIPAAAFRFTPDNDLGYGIMIMMDDFIMCSVQFFGNNELSFIRRYIRDFTY